MNLANNSIVLILVSLVLIYAVLSILVSILVEAWNYRYQERGKYLRKCIYKLLKDPLNNDYGYLFYNHFTIAGLKTFQFKLPHYISSNMFAEAFIDIIAKQAQHDRSVRLVNPDADGLETKQYEFSGAEPAPTVMERFRESVYLMNTSPFSDLLRSFIDKSDGDYLKLKAMIEQWFNDYMDRVSGWYKSGQRTKLLVAGFLVAIALNVDSLHLLKVLSLDDNLKNRLADQAGVVVDNYQAMDSTQKNSATAMNTMILQSLRDTTIKAVTTADSTSYAHLGSLMRLNDSLERNSFVQKDSVAKESIHQLDSTLYILSSLNVPIGWSCHDAPLSWFERGPASWFCDCPPHVTSPQPSGVLTYIQDRNATGGGGNWFRYLAGIIISGFSLSFGAPFWFDLLVKLVNIRRSGKRPEIPSPSAATNPSNK
jgi:hypothetical protein